MFPDNVIYAWNLVDPVQETLSTRQKIILHGAPVHREPHTWGQFNVSNLATSMLFVE